LGFLVQAYDQGLFRFQEPHRKPNPNILSKARAFQRVFVLGDGMNDENNNWHIENFFLCPEFTVVKG